MSRLLRTVVLGALIGAAAVSMLPADEPSPPHALPAVAAGDRLPEFEVRTDGGRQLRSRDLAGRTVLVDFWATWCRPCIQAIPSLQHLNRRFAADPFLLLSINTDRREQTYLEFLDGYDMPWTHTWDRRGALALQFGVDTYPTYLVVDADGSIAYRMTGWSKEMGDQLAWQVFASISRSQRTAEAAP